MKMITLIVSIYMITLGSVYAQYSEMVGMPYNKRILPLRELYAKAVNQWDSNHLADTLAAMRALATSSKDKQLLLEADLLEAYCDYRVVNDRKNIHGLEKIVEIGAREGIADITVRGMFYIGLHHWAFENYEAAFQWYEMVNEELQVISNDDFPDKMDFLSTIGEAYYHFRDYQKANHFFEQAVSTTHPYFRHSWVKAMNTMGLSYVQLGSLEHADSCFRSVLDYVGPEDEAWQGIIAGNLGYNHYLREDYSVAIPLLEKDIRIAERRQDLGLAAGSAIPLSDIFVKEGRLDEARVLMNNAREYIRQSGQKDRLRLLYPVMVRWHILSGREQEAVRYMDSVRVAEKDYQDKFNSMQLLRANQATMLNQRNNALQKLRIEGQEQINRRNLIVAALVIATMLVVIFAYRQRQKNIIRVKDRDLKLLKADKELQDVRQQLVELARKAAQNEEDLRRDKDQELISKLNKQVVLTEEGWSKFSELFNKLHPGFQHRLRGQFPTLTPAEIRCLAMEKLFYSNKEMAALQGISSNAVVVTKHRIRKKLNLNSQEEFSEFVKGI